EEAPPELRFDIGRYVADGATLLSPGEIAAAVGPYTGRGKDFSDVQYALEAIEGLYADRGYSAVHVLLPEQELESGTIHFQVIESRFGQVTVKDNRHTGKQNALNALPGVRPGGIPRARDIARQLRLANENPARQLNVVLKGGERDDLVDASVLVKDLKPEQWTVSLDNTGSKETGISRLGLAYRHANLFDRDHVGQVQIQLSPQYPDRVKVLGGGYKVPLYGSGHSVEFFGGYSNVNSLIGGLTNFQGGGLILSSRYHIPLQRIGSFDPKLSLGLDWRRFSKIEQTDPVPPVTLYNPIVVSPVSLSYALQGKLARSDINLNLSWTVNAAVMNGGKKADFAAYVPNTVSTLTPAYKVARYGAGYFTQVGQDGQIRLAFSGQWSRDELIPGEQFRLGGADGVRGFTEGSESGERGAKLNLEAYLPAYARGDFNLRGLIFADAGAVRANSSGLTTTISSAGLGLRGAYTDRYALRLDAGRIAKAGNDLTQLAGDWRIHATLSGSF
ncbi:ShlB/FhaC/HecB family hemolysin secretion/activation protein, partial [Acidocella sp.]|uniref:ShlB/FhaC/HecB family hemolysin secretion/activation protein n=1 Tax=Acidocella sp. TaxID=50710 RepID=UPI0026083B8F